MTRPAFTRTTANHSTSSHKAAFTAAANATPTAAALARVSAAAARSYHRRVNGLMKAGRLIYSVRTLSAHSTSPTKIDGSAKRAFLPTRSVSRTPRAREQAPQT